MTEKEKIKYLRALDPEGLKRDSDEVLTAYLLTAGELILNKRYPYNRPDDAVVPTRNHVTQCRIALYLLNKRGGEGEISHSENGISRSYGAADVPAALLNEVIPYCGVPL